MAAKHTMEILNALDAYYGTDTRCSLDHENAWQLLIATMLSAQCTDARVNIVTKDLFQKYPSVEAFANADLKELEQDIHSTGFYHNKAKNIIACCKELMEKRYSPFLSGRTDGISRCGTKDRQCNPWQYLRGAQHCGGYACEENFEEIRTVQIRRSGQGGV